MAAGRDRPRLHALEKRARNDDQRTSKISKEETTCPTAPKALDLAKPRDAQSVMASLVSSGTIRGEPHFAPRSASIASELGAKVTATGWAGSKSPSTSCERTARGLYDDPNLATRYLETARTLLRAQTMTDRAIAGHLEALADDYE